jgi:hypothetical protein
MLAAHANLLRMQPLDMQAAKAVTLANCAVLMELDSIR